MAKEANSWRTKLRRTLTSILPVDKSRRGLCLSCGRCCQLPNICPFLRFRKNGKSYCSINFLKSLNCRKYPRTASEHITQEFCGYTFE